MDSDKYYTDLLEKQSKELISKLCNERDAALAREARLREALESIRDMPEYDQDDIHRLRHKARAALSATTEESAATPEPPLSLGPWLSDCCGARIDWKHSVPLLCTACDKPCEATHISGNYHWPQKGVEDANKELSEKLTAALAREINLLIAVGHLEIWFSQNTDGHHHCPWCYGRGDDAHGEVLDWANIVHHPSVDGIPCPIGAALSATSAEVKL